MLVSCTLKIWLLFFSLLKESPICSLPTDVSVKLEACGWQPEAIISNIFW
jgi:hypothetical protein